MRARAARPLAVAIAIVVCAVGCRNNNSQREIFVRELRQQEDEIYQLEDYLAEYQQIIKQNRAENAKLRRELEELRGAKKATGDGQRINELPFGGAAGDRSPTPASSPDRVNGDGEMPPIELGDPVMPDIDLGTPISPEELNAPGELPEGLQGARRLPAAMQLASAESDNSEFIPPPLPVEPADSVALYAEQAPTESQGDVQIGLLAIVEPLRRDGGAGEFHGTLSLLVRDPLDDSEQPELARWDLSIEQVEEGWRDGNRRVLDFALAMPPETPVGRPLELWVRLQPEGGEKLLSHTTIELSPPVNLVGVAASGGPVRLVANEETSQTAWVAAAPTDSEGESIEAPAWKTASQAPPAALAAPPTQKPLMPPTWSPQR